MGATIGGDDVADFAALTDRFENALRSVEESHDPLIGSVDVFGPSAGTCVRAAAA